MSWKHDYLARANRIAAMSVYDAKYAETWNALEDDILGKLAMWQCADLYDFAASIPCQGSMVIISMMPEDLPHADA